MAEDSDQLANKNNHLNPEGGKNKINSDCYTCRQLDTELELRLGPPGEVINTTSTTTLIHGAKRTFQQTKPHDKGWFALQDNGLKSPPPTNTSSPKRSVGGSAVVGWPPIRSSRKNLGSSLTKTGATGKGKGTVEKSGVEVPDHDHNQKKQLFIKINMEGIPIGRKINLSAYNSYQDLSLAIEQLFAALLAAQGDSPATQTTSNVSEGTKGSSIARSGEYTLVYEDDEGDRILVGDVPWNMFVSTAKRLRVLRSSEGTTQSTHSHMNTQNK